MPSQRKIVAPLGKLVEQARAENLGAPAIIFVGNSIGLARSSTWFDQAPLFGRQIVLTRSCGQQSKMRASLERLGAEVLDLPLIEIQPSEDRKLIAEVFAGMPPMNGWFLQVRTEPGISWNSFSVPIWT